MSRIRSDNYTNKAGTGAPNFPHGANVTGIVTATSFTGDLTGDLTGNADTATTATSATTATTATNAEGLTGTPDVTVNNVTAGIVTATTLVGNASQLTGLPAGFTEIDAALFN